MNFIKTKDSNTADKLITQGFTVIDCSNGVWTFLNENIQNVTFDKDEKKHLIYTDVLSI